MVMQYSDSALTSLRTYSTPPRRSLELLVAQILENQLASEKWRTGYPDEDVMTGAVNVPKWSAVLQVGAMQSTFLTHTMAESGQPKTLFSAPLASTVPSAPSRPSLLKLK